MRSITISLIISHLLALTLAVPVGYTPPKKEARDWFDKVGDYLGAKPSSPWASGSHNAFSGLPKRPPRRRTSSPGNQDGVNSKLVKRNIMDWLQDKLHLSPPSVAWGSSSYQQEAGTVMDAISLLKDPLLVHLSEGADDLGHGLALTKSKMLEKVLVEAVTVYQDKDNLVKENFGQNSKFTPKSLLELLGKAQGAKADIPGPATCPDGTVYKKDYVYASYELANLPDLIDKWPQVFNNTHNSDGKKSLLFPDAVGNLMQSPLLDDYLNSGKPGKHSVVIDSKENFLGVVQDNGAEKGFELCTFKKTSR